MVIILYEKDETKFDNMGLGILTDTISCEVTEELNGSFELEMEYPIGGILYNELKEERIIFCKPNPYDNPQPFRIYEVEKPIEGNITVSARHIFYDMNNVPTKMLTVTINKIRQAVNNIKLAIIGEVLQSKWNFNIIDENAFKNKEFKSIEVPHKLSELIFNDNDDSLVNTYKAELKFNKFNCDIYKKRGSNRGLKIEYGKNITSMTHTVNSENNFTGMLPYYSQDISSSSSSTSKNFEAAYIVPDVEPYAYGWISLNPKRSERAKYKLAAYNDNSLYIIKKDSSDTSEVDEYVNTLVDQTGSIDDNIHWRQFTKDELIELGYDLTDERYFPQTLQNCYVVPDSAKLSKYNFCLDPEIPEGGEFSKEDLTYIEIVEEGADPSPNEIMYGQYLYVKDYFKDVYPENSKTKPDDPDLVGYYYTPIYKISKDGEITYPDIPQWEQMFKGIYALKNVDSDNPTLAEEWASFDGITPITDESQLDSNTPYIVINQSVTNPETQVTEANTKVFNVYYYTTSVLGHKFRPDKNWIEWAKRKLKSFTSALTEQEHKSFMYSDSEGVPKPIYFDGYSENDIYQKIAMVDVSSEFSEAPISNVDFTEKLNEKEWVKKHTKDYDHNKVEIDTSFIMLADDPEYTDILYKEQIELGDIITIVHSKLKINDEQRVVSTTYNVMSNKYTEITLQKDEEDDEDEV